MENVFLFTGENAYALRQKRSLWLAQFAERHGAENLSVLNGAKLKVRELLDEVAAAPFIAEKRLVLVDGLPRGEKEDIERLSSQKHPHVVLLFTEPKPDKRLGFVKALLKEVKVEEFSPLGGAPLRTWVQQTAAQTGGSFSTEALQVLLDLYGDDQELLANEIQKLALYALGRTVTADDVRMLMVTVGERQVWALMDLLGAGKTKEALAYVRHLLQQGESPVGLWNIFLWMASNLTPVYAAVSTGVTNPAAIAKQFGVSFPGARSLLPIAKQLNEEQVRHFIDRLTTYDLALKTGGYRSTADDSVEVCALLDSAILACVPSRV